MANGNWLKTCFSIHVLPGDIRDIGWGPPGDPLKPSQKVPLISGRLAVYPCSVRHDGLLGRKDALDSVKSNMSLRLPATLGYFVFQKNSQDLDALERAIVYIRELNDNILSEIGESKSKWRLFNILE